MAEVPTVEQRERDLFRSLSRWIRRPLQSARGLPVQLEITRLGYTAEETNAAVNAFTANGWLDHPLPGFFRMTEAGFAAMPAFTADEPDAGSREPDRGSAVINNTFRGPVASVIQGGGTVGSVVQTQGGSVPDELIRLLRAAIAEFNAEDQPRATAALRTVEAEAGGGTPDPTLIRAALLRIAAFAEKTGSGVASGVVLGYLRTHGWIG
jgi:hypothetical protein